MGVRKGKGVTEAWEDILDPDGDAVGWLGVLEEAGTVGSGESKEEVHDVFVVEGHFGEDLAEGVLFAVVGNEDAGSVVEEVVEVEEVHWVGEEYGWEWEGFGYSNGDGVCIVASLFKGDVFGAGPET